MAAASMMDCKAVLVDTSLDTHILTLVNKSDTVLDFKKKIVSDHMKCYPNYKQIWIQSLKIEFKGRFYHMPDSMLVWNAFQNEGTERKWVIWVDASDNQNTANSKNTNKNRRKKKRKAEAQALSNLKKKKGNETDFYFQDTTVVEQTQLLNVDENLMPESDTNHSGLICLSMHDKPIDTHEKEEDKEGDLCPTRDDTQLKLFNDASLEGDDGQKRETPACNDHANFPLEEKENHIQDTKDQHGIVGSNNDLTIGDNFEPGNKKSEYVIRSQSRVKNVPTGMGLKTRSKKNLLTKSQSIFDCSSGENFGNEKGTTAHAHSSGRTQCLSDSSSMSHHSTRNGSSDAQGKSRGGKSTLKLETSAAIAADNETKPNEFVPDSLSPYI